MPTRSKVTLGVIGGFIALSALGNVAPSDPNLSEVAYIPNGGCMTKRNANRLHAELRDRMEEKGIKVAPFAFVVVFESMWKAGTPPCEDLADTYYEWVRVFHPSPAATVTPASSAPPAPPLSTPVAVPAAPPTPEPPLAKPPPLPSSQQPARTAPHRPVRH